MAKNEAQKQKKLAKKRSKELAKKQTLARKKNRLESLPGQLEATQGSDFAYCGISQEVTRSRIGSLLIIRRVDAGRNLMVRLLVDTALLGIKDGFTQVIPVGSMQAFRDNLNQQREELQPVSPGDAKQFLETAIAFAAQHGFEVPSEFRPLVTILDDIEPSGRHFEMGIDGKPTFLPGPFDTPQTIAATIAKLSEIDGIDVDQAAVADAMLGGSGGDGDLAALDDPELDVDIDEDVVRMIDEDVVEMTADELERQSRPAANP